MSFYRDQLEEYLGTLIIDAEKVVDVGGWSNPVKDRVDIWNVETYHIFDNGLEQPKESGLAVRDDYDLSRKYNGMNISDDYDIVFCLEVMEYIWRPNIALRNINDVLKKDGILYITFPFIYPVHNPNEYDYLRYTKTGAIKLLNEAGFKILDVIPRTMTPEGQALIRQFRIVEGMHAAKGVVHNELGVIIKAQKI